MTKETKTIRVAIMRPTFLKGKPLEVGKTPTLPEKDAKDLIFSGKAVKYEGMTPEQKEEIRQEEERLKAKDKKKSTLTPSEIAFAKAKGQKEEDALKAGKSGDAGQGGETDGQGDGDDSGDGDDEVILTKEQLEEKTNAELGDILDELEIPFNKNVNKDARIEMILDAQKAAE